MGGLMTDTQGPLNWIWMHSGTEIKHFDWFPGEPTNEEDGAFIAMYCYDDFAWWDYPTGHSSVWYSYICEADIF